MAFLDGTVVNVALPAMGEDLNADIAGLQWIVNGYMLMLASLILLSGSLGDRLGRRRIFVVGVIWFAVASLICAVAPNLEVMIAGRVLQGIGGALLTPGSLAILQTSFQPLRPRQGSRHLVRSHLGRRGDRPVRRRLAGRQRLVAVDLPDQHAHSHSSPCW